MSDYTVKAPTLAFEITKKIQSLLASGEYKAGDRLPTESELATMFGVSRSSIREATKLLNYLGILESRAALGTFIKDASGIYKDAMTWAFLLQQSDLMPLVDYREAIEAQSIRRMALRYRENKADIEPILDEMARICAQMDDLISQYEFGELTKIDYQFHSLVVTTSNNRYFSSVFQLLATFLAEEMRAVNKSRILHHDLEQLSGDHMIYLDAIRSGDPRIAQEAVYTHVDMVRYWLNKTVTDKPSAKQA